MVTHHLHLSRKSVHIQLNDIGCRRISGGPSAAALRGRIGGTLALDKVISGYGHAVFQRSRRAIAIAHGQRINGQVAQAHARDIKFCPRPFPAAVGMHGHPGDQAHFVGLAGQLLKGNWLHTSAPQAIWANAQISQLHIEAGHGATACPLAPDRTRCRPQGELQQKACCLARGKADVIHARRRTHIRHDGWHPVRIVLGVLILQLLVSPGTGQWQFRKLRHAKLHFVRCFAQRLPHHGLLCRRRARANFLHAMAHAQLAVAVKLQHQNAGVTAGTIDLLHLRKTNAIALAGVGRLKIRLGFLAIDPQRVLRCQIQHLQQARITRLHAPLCVLPTFTQGIAPAQLDRVQPQFPSDLVDHHLGNAQRLQGAKAPHGACLHRAGGQRHGGQIRFGKVVDGLRPTRRHV